MPEKNTGRKLQKHLVATARILASIVMIGVILVLIPLSIPRFLGYETFDIISGSMEPELPVGSLILVKSIDPYEVEEGDIIAFYSNGAVVAHRVVKNNTMEGKFITKGDANAEKDINDPVYSQLIGRVERHYPYFGVLGSYFSTVSGKLLLGELIVCALLLFVISGHMRS